MGFKKSRNRDDICSNKLENYRFEIFNMVGSAIRNFYIFLLLNSLNKLKEIFNKTKVEEKQELIHMMNIVGNQSTHEAADHYGWKEGSTEKLLLYGAIGALTGSMSGGNALSGAVSGSVNEFALAYMEKTKGRNWMDTHPDTVQAISTALGAVAGSLTGDRTTGPEKGISGFIYAENMNSYNKGIAYLKQESFIQDSAVSWFKEYNWYLRLGVDWKHPAVRLPGIHADV